MNKLKIAVLFGGQSEERDVSIKSAREVAAHIDCEKYDPIYIGITKSGIWGICEKPCAEWENQSHWLSEPGFADMGIDAVFPVLHGKTGEDGKIQGFLEVCGVPYVGCDIQSSVICMDKSLAYLAVRDVGIATPDFDVLYPGDTPGFGDFPVFVKPARSGSSFGVTKVTNRDELNVAIEMARQYDGKILIEQAISGIEVGCAVLGNKSNLVVGEVDQITLSHGIFRIHQETEPEKGSENAIFTVPANIPAAQRVKIQETAKNIYRALGCSGLARVDMFLQENGCIVLNEVNTMPGFTSYSRYPRMMAASGMTLSEVTDRLIALALEG